MKDLSSLELECPEITDAGLATVAKLTALVRLNIMDTRVTDEGLLALVSLPKLEELWVGPPIGEKGMAIIAKMPKLSTLVAVITRDDALVPLKEIRNPVTLNLSNSRITDAALAHVVKLPKLQNLMLYRTPITDASLPYLKRLKRLKLLEVGGTDLSEAAIGQLSAALPDTQVSWGEPRTCFPDPTAESNKEEEKRESKRGRS